MLKCVALGQHEIDKDAIAAAAAKLSTVVHLRLMTRLVTNLTKCSGPQDCCFLLRHCDKASHREMEPSFERCPCCAAELALGVQVKLPFFVALWEHRFKRSMFELLWEKASTRLRLVWRFGL